MNYHLYPISFRKYSLIIFYAFLLLAIIAWTMELYFEKLYGDLTRVGYFSEHDFGWQLEQPAIPNELFKDYSLAEADILVIGDSFSEYRIWQSRLTANGLKVSTLTWRDLKKDSAEMLPANLGEVLRKAGFKGHYVVIESIERFFQLRMKTLSKEQKTIIKPDPAPTILSVKRERFSFSKLNGVEWGKETLYNKIKLILKLPEKYFESNSVKIVGFPGCQLFSHRLCDYAIFIDMDFQKETFDSIANVLSINKNLKIAGIQPIWMVVPDKSTVYLGYGKLNKYPYQNIWQSLAQYPELIAPDLGTTFIQKSRTMTDFYLPNDTHLSVSGFLYLGDFMLREIRNLQSPQVSANSLEF